MKFFIGIVPPEHIYKTIINIQLQFGDNRLEPHITLRPPVTLIDPDSWLDTIKLTANTFSPFTIRLPGTGYFGTRVLFVTVQSKGLEEIQKHLTTRLKVFEPPDNKQNVSYHPHLTLGRKWCGFSKSDFGAMQKLVDEYLREKEVAFEVTFLRVYFKRGDGKRYEKMLDVPLN